MAGHFAETDSDPFAVGGYVTARYWVTASTWFANPAVTPFANRLRSHGPDSSQASSSSQRSASTPAVSEWLDALRRIHSSAKSADH